jgi:two-component system, OmpR family, response regulator
MMTPDVSETRDWAAKKVFTTGEAAEICKVSQQTIIRCFDSGRLQGFRVPGSRFRRIPRDELLRFMRENDIPTEALETAGKKRVLVVDDDPQIAELFVEALGRDGRFDVRVARNGYDAGMLTEAFRPDAIILDYMLPDVNGNIVCQRIRENDAFLKTKIIFVSGVVNPEEIEKLKRAGADDFIRKPFNIEKLIARLAELVTI